WEKVDWPAEVKNLENLSCPHCQSSLVGQADVNNESHGTIDGKCFQYGELVSRETLLEDVVKVSYETDAYIMAKEGLNPPIGYCPECGLETYVEDGETSICFNCGFSVAGECYRCGAGIDLNEYNPDYSGLCSYCAHTWEKVMKE
ncbi:MAG: hypothetical protein AAF202_13590, partial [Pseudomonadota bacterium]